MASQADALRICKTALAPVLADHGFEGRFPYFHRRGAQSTEVFFVTAFVRGGVQLHLGSAAPRARLEARRPDRDAGALLRSYSPAARWLIDTPGQRAALARELGPAVDTVLRTEGRAFWKHHDRELAEEAAREAMHTAITTGDRAAVRRLLRETKPAARAALLDLRLDWAKRATVERVYEVAPELLHLRPPWLLGAVLGMGAALARSASVVAGRDGRKVPLAGGTSNASAEAGVSLVSGPAKRGGRQAPPAGRTSNASAVPGVALGSATERGGRQAPPAGGTSNASADTAEASVALGSAPAKLVGRKAPPAGRTSNASAPAGVALGSAPAERGGRKAPSAGGTSNASAEGADQVLAWLRPHLRRVEDLAAQLAIMADGLLIGPARRPAAAALLFDLVLPTGACTAPQLGNALHAVLATTCGEPVDRARHQRMLRHALAFGAGDASVQFNAACLCMELGERTKAVEHLAAALRLGADPAHLHAEPLVLPTGIFYAQGVKTNVLFFTRGATDKGNTKATWFFDMRSNMPSFGKRTPFTSEHFAEFMKAFGDNAHGKGKRKDQGEEGRFRKFTREAIKERNDNLDVSWLKDDSHVEAEDLPEPEVVLAQIREKLEGALQAVAELEATMEAGS